MNEKETIKAEEKMRQFETQWKFVRKYRKDGGMGPRCIVRTGDFDGIGGPVVAQIQDATQDEIALIAAAPELLAALRELVRYGHDEDAWEHVSHAMLGAVERARAAIARVEASERRALYE